MRFFTMAWWCGCQTGEAGEPSAAYAGHLATLRHRLPPDQLATEESVSLHDSRLRELRLLPTEATLSLELDSYAGDERFTLTYTGVERFESAADPEVGLGESGRVRRPGVLGGGRAVGWSVRAPAAVLHRNRTGRGVPRVPAPAGQSRRTRRCT